jgi:hypothetical protein
MLLEMYIFIWNEKRRRQLSNPRCVHLQSAQP